LNLVTDFIDCFRAASLVYLSAKHFPSEEFLGNCFQCLQTGFREIYTERVLSTNGGNVEDWPLTMKLLFVTSNNKIHSNTLKNNISI